MVPREGCVKAIFAKDGVRGVHIVPAGAFQKTEAFHIEKHTLQTGERFSGGQRMVLTVNISHFEHCIAKRANRKPARVQDAGQRWI